MKDLVEVCAWVMVGTGLIGIVFAAGAVYGRSNGFCNHDRGRTQ